PARRGDQRPNRIGLRTDRLADAELRHERRQDLKRRSKQHRDPRAARRMGRVGVNVGYHPLTTTDRVARCNEAGRISYDNCPARGHPEPMTSSRPLTDGETRLAASVFGDAIDYARVRIANRKWIFF